MTPTRRTTREFVGLTSDSSGGVPHFSALDGLRGLAVAGVLAYHCGFSVMIGGFLGVSTFFTLSGFLITSLLVRESQTHGRIALGRFWSRRFRRLLPASLATLALVATLFTAFVATNDQKATLRGDIFASLLDVVNWRFIAEDTAYGALFAAPSPVLHFWSLAIEEQLYLILPLTIVALWKLCGAKVWRVGAALGALAVVSWALPFVFTMSDDRIYFGTDTRAVELLLGGVLAAVFTHGPTRRRIALDRRVRAAVLMVGGACLAVQLVWWWGLEQSTPWLYRGGFAVYALMTCAVILAAALPSGPLHTALDVAPIRWLGRRSYGVYLAHWPIFLTMRQLYPELSTPVRSVIAVGATLVIAELSYRVVEQPVRLGRWPDPRRAPVMACTAIVVVAALAALALPDSGDTTLDFEAAAAGFDQRPTVTPTTAPPAGSAVPPVPRVFTVGDSTSLFTAMGMAVWGRETGRLVDVGGESEAGCPISRFAESRFDVDIEATPNCVDWPEVWPALLATQQPDVVQIITGVWEVPDVRLPFTEEFAAIGDPSVDDFILRELTLAVDTLAADGAMVLMVLSPPIGQWAVEGGLEAYRRQADPARTQRLHEIQRFVASQRPDTVRVLDFAGWLGDRVDDESLRPDGTHISGEDMVVIYREWMGPETVRIHRDWWTTHRAPVPPGG